MELIEVTVTALGSDGQGIGHLPSGKTCFAAGAFPGETCLCRIESEKAKYAVCDVIEITKKSSDRISPFVPANEVSGGLPLAHLSYKAQLEYKESRVRDCLIRIGGFDKDMIDSVFKPIEGCEDPDRYRNHLQYAIRDGKAGLLCSKSDRLGQYDGELIEYEIFGKIRDALEKVLERAPTRLLEGLVLRGSLRTKEVLAEFVSSSDQPHEVVIRDIGAYIGGTGLFETFNNVCKKDGFRLNGLLLRISPAGISKRTRTGIRTAVRGVDYYNEIFCGRRMRIKAGSFFQVNTAQAEKLANKASGLCRSAYVIYDLYCGCGTLGLAVKQKGQKLLGIEAVPEAVASAKINRSLALPEDEISECEFICKDVLKTDFTSLIKSTKILPPDCIIVDPPRKGLDVGVVKKLLELGAPSICCISCDPATLARDLKMLARDYSIREVTPIDLMPNSSHVETVCLLSNRKPDSYVHLNLKMEDYYRIKDAEKEQGKK